MEEEAVKPKPGRVKAVVKLLFVLALLFAAVGGVVLLIKEKPEVLGLTKSETATQSEVETLLAEINKLISLPTDETPTVATVSDVEKIRSQPFFEKAKNGDRVLIYPTSKRVILYRPSEKRIIDVGAVNINMGSSPSPTATSSASPAATITPTP